MDNGPIVIIANKALSSQATLGDLLSTEGRIVSVVREAQLEFWLDEPEQKPDLLILDQDFFGAATNDFCQRWFAHPMMRDVAILFTGPADENAELNALTCGALDYLPKPFKPVLTLARVRLRLKQIAERRSLASMSMTDGLTHIANRRYFNDVFQAEWRRACREKSSMGLIMMDIDYFKPFNDHYGHLAGDECLTAVAQALKSVVQRPRDFVARYGGEEFVALLPSVHEDGLQIVAQRMQQAIADLAIEHQGSKAKDIVSISMGLAWCEPESGWQAEQLIAAADEALYTSKDNGRDRMSEVVVLQPELLFQGN
jgi:diguanylate cyclase (GGDEF)-like protein